MAPLGRPVVPEVYDNTARSLSLTATSGAVEGASPMVLPRERARNFYWRRDDDVLQLGRLGFRRQCDGSERREGQQRLGATISHDIGDFA
jgi:hypothetical protein